MLCGFCKIWSAARLAVESAGGNSAGATFIQGGEGKLEVEIFTDNLGHLAPPGLDKGVQEGPWIAGGKWSEGTHHKDKNQTAYQKCLIHPDSFGEVVEIYSTGLYS